MTSSMCRCFCSIVPPYLLKELGTKSDDPQVRQAVAETRATDRKLRAVRASLLGNTLMRGWRPRRRRSSAACSIASTPTIRHAGKCSKRVVAYQAISP
jgi:hypothetical protein